MGLHAEAKLGCCCSALAVFSGCLIGGETLGVGLAVTVTGHGNVGSLLRLAADHASTHATSLQGLLAVSRVIACNCFHVMYYDTDATTAAASTIN